jgi:UDP-4-amino-4,6-dideoxy-N-acetyl-beta-L-altrosamine transaminase
LDDSDIDAVVSVLRSDWLTQGPRVPEFEASIAKYCDVRYAVAFSSGTSALHGACHAAGIGFGDEVITTPITFAASANCVRQCGGHPIFADIEDDTCTLDPDAVARAITSRTRAIIPVDFAGHPCRMDDIRALATRRGLTVIEDAAHALGAEYRGQPLGSLADMTVFSFHPVKILTTGEGGMVVTSNDDLYERLLRFRNHGITRDASVHPPWFYEQHELGINGRMTDIQAALGVSQMSKIRQFSDRRRAIVDRYQAAFANISEVRLPVELNGVKSAWHLYVIRLRLESLEWSRRKVFETLRTMGLGVQVHYIPVYTHPYYRQQESCGASPVRCDRAEQYYEEAISLPLFPKMTDDDVEYVIETVHEVIDAAKRHPLH